MELLIKYLMRMMNLFLPTCEQVSRLTSHALDEPLTWRERSGRSLHVMACVFCRRNARQMEIMRILIQSHAGAAAPDAAPPCLSPQARQRIAEAIDSADSRPSH
jgi:hypothetical protein